VAVRVEARASGVRVVYSSDTGPCAAVERLAKGARLLVHEATFSARQDADASRFAHSTAAQAGRLARAAGVEALWLVHFTPTDGVTCETQRAEAAAEFAGGVAVPPDFAPFEF
jgi:ribonuclease Z